MRAGSPTTEPGLVEGKFNLEISKIESRRVVQGLEVGKGKSRTSRFTQL
jgi:hypothetical protein